MAALLRRGSVGIFGRATGTRLFSAGAGGEPLVVLEKRQDIGVAVLTLNRPKALNALSDGLMTELVAKLKEVDADETVRAAIVTGTGKAFAAGADIKEMNTRENYATVRNSNMLAHWSSVSDIRKPIIAAVNGFALGGGCELAMSCDVIIASEDAKFGQPEIKLGTIPGVGGTQRLLKAVGKSKAMELVLTGDMLTAKEAESAGLVSRVVPSGTSLEEAVKVAEKIAKYSSPVVALAKECVNVAEETSLAEGLRLERSLFHATWGLADRREGFQAFIDKRAPEWKHS
jgi:enoyl-CoA hydratase/carnithine racemase|eukprot:TRINITY_DN75156_c0_g1_i1.p1 TRINITY_DN75156_c0_g1~~TRINITY_DN75156_c0_g1_i1.p1  ORF type:complete len:287 (-),score=61.31 TRINITY_DN75156_c0_g1_i1:158-1018(-)